MAWASSNAVISTGSNGIISTKGNRSLIVGDWSNDYLEIYGANDTVLGGGGSDSIGVMLYPEQGMSGNYAYIDGGYGSDVIVAAAIQGNQYATIVGGTGIDSYGIGCNSDSTINVVFEDFDTYWEPVAIFYEGYNDGGFTCYSTDNGLIVRDDAGRLNTTLKGVTDYNNILNNGWLWIYPHGVRSENALTAAAIVWYYGEWKRFGDVVRYGGYVPGGVETESTTLEVTDNTKSPVTVGSSVETIDASDRTKKIKITGNALDNSIIGGEGDDTLNGGKGNDTLTGGDGSDIFIYSAGKDVITDYAAGDRISIGSAVTNVEIDSSDVVFSFKNGSLTVKDGKDQSLDMINFSGKSFSTIFGDSYDPALMTVNDNTKSPVTVGSSVETIDASDRTKKIKITGNALDNSIIGGEGDDTLNGGKGNDTLTGGDGSDVFIYSAGKDVITDYAAGDRISIGSAISKATVDGADVVFSFKNGSLTVKDGKSKSLSMINSSGKSFSTIIGGSSSDSSDSDLMTVTNSSASVVTAGAAIKTVDASKRTKAIKITGNALDNSIKGSAAVDTISGGDGADTISGGKGNDSIHGGSGNDRLYGNAGADVLFGGAGKDSLYGGAGNDTLWGSNGTDTFIYQAGGGTDEIMDYASGELLRILTKDGKSNATFSKSTFDDDTLTLEIKGGGTVIFNNIDDETKFNINGTSYKVSGSKLAKD